MKSFFRKIFCISLFFCCLAAFAQYAVPEKPAILYPVYHAANLLSPQQREALNQKLITYADSTSSEIEVVIIPSTKGEDVNWLAIEFANKWKIGQKGVNNGVVLLVATDDHTLSIQQGRTVEQYITASTAGQIIDYLIVPKFKQGLWYEGIDAGTTAIMEAMQGKFKPLQKNEPQETHFSIFEIILIVLVIIFLFSFFSGNNGGGNYRNSDDVVISRRGSRRYPGGVFFPGGFGGGFGGSSGGGGFGGFGSGGSFGGGGASGSW